LGVFLFFGIYTVYAEFTPVWDEPVTSGWRLTSDRWNEMVNKLLDLDSRGSSIDTRVTTLESTGGVPSGSVMAFNLNICPQNWSLADGTGVSGDFVNLDLRGQFVRGLDDSAPSIGIDPESPRTLGSDQDDELESHQHQLANGAGTDSSRSGEFSAWRGGASQRYTLTDGGGAETRPKNVALIYCVKD